jgi:N-acetylmuramic acid 6-phosphate (MurNAc-6-P) etherase
MAKDNVTLKNLDEKMFDAAKSSLGSTFASVKVYWKAESEKLAITLRMIIESSAANEISRAEAKILLNQQKVATSAVLTAVEGMSAVAAQAALNAALKAAKDLVNSKIGFPLL